MPAKAKDSCRVRGRRRRMLHVGRRSETESWDSTTSPKLAKSHERGRPSQRKGDGIDTAATETL
eukprot:scaffold5113_cov364-Pinguiococcus_pyrenoidosus.AAC.7